jgi:NAD(P)-dependent dehydrogenase (short-subunit alcohol dehydrogenase family)
MGDSSLVPPENQIRPPPNQFSHQVDVADLAAVRRFVEDTISTYRRLHAVINCAGMVGTPTPSWMPVTTSGTR